MPPTYQGCRYMDGGLTNNLPTIDQFTISVNPFCGESDICPVDDSSRLFHVSYQGYKSDERVVVGIWNVGHTLLYNFCRSVRKFS